MRRAPALALALGLLPALAAAGLRPAWGGTIAVVLPSAPELADGASDPADLLARRAVSAPLLELDPAGRLLPGALAEVPEPGEGGRTFRLRVREGVLDAGGRRLGAADVARRLAAALEEGEASPYGFLALPIAGAEAMLEGRATELAGARVLSETELEVTLSLPLPTFARALAATPLALPGAGPFLLGARAAPGEPLRLVANPRHHAGRPFAATVELSALGARAAARALARGDADLVLRPEAAGGRPGPALPALTATVAVVNGARLGAGAEPLRRILAALDRGELARRFVHGRAEPLPTLVPPALLPGVPLPPPPEPRGAAGAPPRRVTILADGRAPDQRALAERLQVKLFDRGVTAALELLDAPRLRARLAAGEHDVALVPVTVVAPDPALAAAQVAWVASGAAAARRALAELGGATPEAAPGILERLARELGLVPLVAAAPRASLGPALEGLAPRPDGGVGLADLWRVGGGAP